MCPAVLARLFCLHVCADVPPANAAPPAVAAQQSEPESEAGAMAVSEHVIENVVSDPVAYRSVASVRLPCQEEHGRSDYGSGEK